MPAATAGPSAPGTLGRLGLPRRRSRASWVTSPTTSRLQRSSGGSAEAGVRGLVGVEWADPSGDDALRVLLTLAAVDAPEARDARAAVVAAVRSVLSRTTSLSAALLVAAGAGYGVPDVARLVTLVAGAGSLGRNERPEPTPGASYAGSIRPVGPFPELTNLTNLTSLANLVGRVLAIGHSSGRDLLSGVSGALRAVDALSSPSANTPTKEPSVTDHLEVRTGAYYDSVSLMQVSRQVASAPGWGPPRSPWPPSSTSRCIGGMGFDVPKSSSPTTWSWRSGATTTTASRAG